MQRYVFSLDHKVPGGERKMAGCSFSGTLPPAIVLGKVQCVAYSVSKECSMLGASISRMLWSRLYAISGVVLRRLNIASKSRSSDAICESSRASLSSWRQARTAGVYVRMKGTPIEVVGFVTVRSSNSFLDFCSVVAGTTMSAVYPRAYRCCLNSAMFDS